MGILPLNTFLSNLCMVNFMFFQKVFTGKRFLNLISFNKFCIVVIPSKQNTNSNINCFQRHPFQHSQTSTWTHIQLIILIVLNKRWNNVLNRLQYIKQKSAVRCVYRHWIACIVCFACFAHLCNVHRVEWYLSGFFLYVNGIDFFPSSTPTCVFACNGFFVVNVTPYVKVLQRDDY